MSECKRLISLSARQYAKFKALSELLLRPPVNTGRWVVLTVGPISGLFIGAEFLYFTWSIHWMDRRRIGLSADFGEGFGSTYISVFVLVFRMHNSKCFFRWLLNGLIAPVCEISCNKSLSNWWLWPGAEENEFFFVDGTP